MDQPAFRVERDSAVAAYNNFCRRGLRSTDRCGNYMTISYDGRQDICATCNSKHQVMHQATSVDRPEFVERKSPTSAANTRRHGREGWGHRSPSGDCSSRLGKSSRAYAIRGSATGNQILEVGSRQVPAVTKNHDFKGIPQFSLPAGPTRFRPFPASLLDDC